MHIHKLIGICLITCCLIFGMYWVALIIGYFLAFRFETIAPTFCVVLCILSINALTVSHAGLLIATTAILLLLLGKMRSYFRFAEL